MTDEKERKERVKKENKGSLNVEFILDELGKLYPDAGCELKYSNVYELLVAVILSAQTTDVSVNKVTPVLFATYPTVFDLACADQADVEAIIRTIGLYRSKAKNIIGAAKGVVEMYGGEVPHTHEELMRLPGVGRKTANVIMAEAFGEQTIAVDTHVFRLANRIGLAHERDPEKTEIALLKVLPPDRYTEAHHLLIFHGRRMCKARKPECEKCPITVQCEYYQESTDKEVASTVKDLKITE